MQTLYSLIFFKDDQPLSCRIVRMEISDLPQILAFQQEIYQNLPDKDILFPPATGGLGVPDEPRLHAGCLPGGKRPGWPTSSAASTPNGRKIWDWTSACGTTELDQVGQLEIAMASPDFRGYHMHSRMCSVCVDLFKQDGRTRFILSTVSPRNLPSLKALQSAGLQPLVEKEKYGGKLRYVMFRAI